MLPLHVASQSPWVIDSGASIHTTSTYSVLLDISPAGHPSRVTLADGSTSHVTGSGSLCSSLSLSSVLYVPQF